MGLELYTKKQLFAEIIKNIKGVIIEDEKISFYVRDVNNDENNKYIKDNLDYLRKHFKTLAPRSRTPKKMTTSTLISIFKECKYEYIKKTKMYYVDQLKTTSGFYLINVN
tara:strand:- start:581 stop:910 length:330 start_codon:yes stop_codon:yes gene_type:complete